MMRPTFSPHRQEKKSPLAPSSLDGTFSLLASSDPNLGGTGNGSNRVSKLEAEVKRLEAKGSTLVKKEGSELEGVSLLEKALSARARFSTLQREPWVFGENFVIVCNQLAVRVMQRLGDDYQIVARELLLAAERAVTQQQGNDPFAGFHPLRQALHAATLSNFAALQRLCGAAPEHILDTMEKAAAIEGTHVCSMTLFNLAAAYTQTNNFDEAADAVTRCIALASHNMSLPVTLSTPRDQSYYHSFRTEESQNAILGHHLVASLSTWASNIRIARHHSRLALACAERYLGTEHALTTRCAERLGAVDREDWELLVDDTDESPVIPLQTATFTTIAPSTRIPFSLVTPPPPSVLAGTAPPSKGTGGSGSSSSPLRLPPVSGNKRRGGGAQPSVSNIAATVLGVSAASRGGTTSISGGRKARGSAVGSAPLSLHPILDAVDFSQQQEARTLQLTGGGASGATTTGRGSTAGMTATAISSGKGRASIIPSAPLQPRPSTSEVSLKGGDAAGQRRVRSSTTLVDASTPQRGPGALQSESAEKPSAGMQPRPPLKGRASKGFHEEDPDIETLLAPKPTQIPQPPSSAPGQKRSSLAALETASTASTSTRNLNLVPQPPPRTLRRTPQPGPQSTRVTSVIPKSDYEQYVALQEEVERAVALGSVVPGTRAVQTSGQRQGAGLVGGVVSQGATSGMSATAGLVNRHDDRGLALPSPFQLLHRDGAAVEFEDVRDHLRQGDAFLQSMSTVQPDHTDAEEQLWQEAAAKIQRQWCIAKARIAVRQRKKAVQQSIKRDEAALVVIDFFRRVSMKRLAQVVLDGKRHEKKMNAHASTIAVFCQQWLSTEEGGVRCLQQLEAQRDQWRRWRREQCAATVIQSVYRSHATRMVLMQRRHNVEVLQRTWRLFTLYNEVRMIVFKRRQRRRDVEQHRAMQATTIQRWARLRLKGMWAKRTLARMREELLRHLEANHQVEQRYWEQLQGVDEEACSLRIQTACRRKAVFEQQVLWFAAEKQRIVAARRIKRWYRFLTAKKVMNDRRGEKQAKQRILKRKEEVWESCIDVQKVVRGFLARCRVRRMLRVVEQRHAAARKIQQFARRCSHRAEFRAKRDAKQWEEERYLLAQSRRYAAIKVQATWRMMRDRIFVRQYRTFMGRTRHTYANRIQRAGRRFLARRRRALLQAQDHGQRESLQSRELRECSAARIQKTWKMHVEKRSKYHLLFAPTEARRRAASMFQRLWRFYWSQERVRRLRLQRQAHEQNTLNTEHCYVYAIQLQCFIRKYILAPRRITSRRGEIQAGAACNIQRVWRGRKDRQTVEHIRHRRFLNADERFSDEEVQFAAVRVQKCFKGYQQRKIFGVIHRAATVIAYAFRSHVARAKVQALRHEREEDQRITLQKERSHAALSIQSLWRFQHRRRRSTTKQ